MNGIASFASPVISVGIGFALVELCHRFVCVAPPTKLHGNILLRLTCLLPLCLLWKKEWADLLRMVTFVECLVNLHAMLDE